MMLLPFVRFRDRFQSLTTGDCDQRLGEIVRGSHCAQECFVILSSPHLTHALRRYITNPSPSGKGLVAVGLCHFDPPFLLTFRPPLKLKAQHVQQEANHQQLNASLVCDPHDGRQDERH
jgi:hypothetical protein